MVKASSLLWLPEITSSATPPASRNSETRCLSLLRVRGYLAGWASTASPPIFEPVSKMKERNQKIYEVYNEGYSQYQIAEVLGFSQAYINQIIKKIRGSVEE